LVIEAPDDLSYPVPEGQAILAREPDMKIGSPPEGACSDTESDIRALRQQFGVPQGSHVTLLDGLFGGTSP